MSQYFSKSYEFLTRDIGVDLSNYATKTYLKNTTGIDASKLAAKSDLATLKAEINKLDIGKLEPFSVDLINVRDI